jgi:site-specific recombinase XerD
MALTPTELLDDWLRVLHAADRSGRTIDRYATAIRDFLAWYEAQERRPLSVADLTPITLIGYRRALQQKAATSTVNVHVTALNMWTRWLCERGYVDAAQVTHVRMIKRLSPLAPRALADTEVNALLRAAQGSRHAERNYAIIQMLLQTGMRIGECAALSERDITFGERGGAVTIRAGKGNKARTVPLNGTARAALAGYLAPQLGVEPTIKAVAAAWPQHRFSRAGRRPTEWARDTESERNGTAPLFLSQKGQRLDSTAIWRMFIGLVDACAIRGLVRSDTTPHALRHTFGRCYLAAHPGDLVGLARLLGHSSLDTTSIYTQPTADELALKVEQLPLNAYGEDGERTAPQKRRRAGARLRNRAPGS